MRGAVLDGRYKLVERLGRGGMGQVWAASDRRMQRDVAVKLVTALPRVGEHETFLRFRREIRSAAGLPGRYTVIAHDCGEAVLDDERVLYMVMERLTGRTLHEEVVRDRPTWQLAVRWGRQVAAALDAAHRQGIVHRDIKPENVMFTADGDLKVLDFGIAKFLGDTVLANGLTGTGVAIGSLLYMSPEQARGEHTVDHRTDLYSFGCLLHFMLTGRPPFVAGNAYAQMHLLMHGEVEPPHLRDPEIPARLGELVTHLLARQPDRRPASAREVLERLEWTDKAGRPGEPKAVAPPGPEADPRAWAEAEAVLREAGEAADRVRATAEQDVTRVRATAERDIAAMRAAAQRDVQAKREEADALFEETRAKAAQAAADFETKLAERREQSERDLASRQSKAEKRLATIEHRAEQLRLEAEKLRHDAEQRARRTVETGQDQAARIVADARAAADRIVGPETLGTLKETVAAILDDSRFMPVGGLVEQRATILRQLDELHEALAELLDGRNAGAPP